MDKEKAEGVSASEDIKREDIEKVDVEQAGRLMVELERFVDAGIISGETYDNIRRRVEEKLEVVKEESERSEYEIKNEFVSREILTRHVPKLMGDLSDVDFHSWYHLLWTLSTHRMLERMRQEEGERGE